jgi:hypothetical protein
MNCTFCQTNIDNSSVGPCAYFCNHCNTDYYYNDESPQELLYITFELDNYLIELDINNKLCKLYKGSPINNKYMFTLDYIPNITPNNANYWLNRFLNLKVFL